MVNYPSTKKKIVDIKKVQFKEINHKQDFFNSLREEYEEFDEWFVKKAEEEAFIVENNNRLEAMTAYKEEQEQNQTVLKIRIIKSDVSIYFLEWVIFEAIHYAIEKDIKKIYFTHFIQKVDKLKEIANTFGFNSDKINQRQENVFEKELYYDSSKDIKSNFPYMIINSNTKFFLIPIRKEYSNALLPKEESPNLFNIIHSSKEGNAIEKIYVCSSNITTLKQGSLVLFYESKNIKSVVAVGTITKFERISKKEDFKKYQDRSVFSEEDINKMLKEDTQELLIISFILSSYLNKGLPHYITVPQSIMELTGEEFKKILEGERTWKLLYLSDQSI
ncbi:MAG: hypothetical protein LBH40_00120 [Alphaproteobacteria bacterium]|jgi:hypothetical protein|nr:hypothetical protein [Alphaproteobacteria bacterium]